MAVLHRAKRGTNSQNHEKEKALAPQIPKVIRAVPLLK